MDGPRETAAAHPPRGGRDPPLAGAAEGQHRRPRQGIGEPQPDTGTADQTGHAEEGQILLGQKRQHPPREPDAVDGGHFHRKVLAHRDMGGRHHEPLRTDQGAAAAAQDDAMRLRLPLARRIGEHGHEARARDEPAQGGFRRRRDGHGGGRRRRCRAGREQQTEKEHGRGFDRPGARAAGG